MKKTMTSTLKSNFWGVCLFGLLAMTLPAAARAQEAQTITVSPTLFDIIASPAQPWESQLRVVNVNNYEISVYLEPVNFAPLGESGRGTLIPIVSEETRGGTLAEWITIAAGPIQVPPQQTVTVPFTLRVPEDAAPGGHYAAIMVGTKPPESPDGASKVQTAQYVTSLMFLRVAGDVIEAGDIREFRANDSFVQRPDTSFMVRFENKGTVHVQPQGDIKIYNMWGAERGTIPINHQTDFGNVLPNSIREFQFAWKADVSLYDMGRYQAIATLAYGEEAKQFVTATSYFWVIPLKQLAILIGAIALFAGILVLSVRLYVRKMLSLAGIEPTPIQRGQRRPDTTVRRAEVAPVKTVVVSRYQQALAPARLELREFLRQFTAWNKPRELLVRLWLYVKRRKLVVGLMMALILMLILVGWFVSMVGERAVSYEVTIHNTDSSVTYSAEDLAYNDLRAATPRTVTGTTTPITVINASGQSAAAARVKILLEDQGLTVGALAADPERADNRTVIVFSPTEEALAKRVSELLGGALMSYGPADGPAGVVVYVGSDVDNLADQSR